MRFWSLHCQKQIKSLKQDWNISNLQKTETIQSKKTWHSPPLISQMKINFKANEQKQRKFLSNYNWNDMSIGSFKVKTKALLFN